MFVKYKDAKHLKNRTMKKMICAFLVMVTMMTLGSAGQNSILPKPKEITYGDGSIPVKGLSIGFANLPCEEDNFAARELAGIFSEVTYSTIPVKGFTKDATLIFERTGEPEPLPSPGEKAGPDSRESYQIKITPDNIWITSKSSAGLFYAVQTLRQMIEGTGDEAKLPAVEIKDWSTMVYRGFMMDMSHFQLPKIEEIKSQIDFMARWKANQYLFYSECSIEMDGYPLLMADARFTREQVKEVVEYARQRHIDVIPNMDLYGHLHDIFRLEKYSDMAVVPHGGEFSPDHPGVKPLLEDMISQISLLFPSPFFHIGFDETWLLEVEAEKRGVTPEKLYSGMLKQTTDIVKKNGKVALFWADMLQKYPSMIPGTPEGTYAVPWHYSPMDDSRYKKLLSPFSESGVPMIVQGAILNWNWVVPGCEKSFTNTDLLIKAGLKYNAIGFINSGWTDTPLNLMRMGYPDIAYGSVASWEGQGPQHEEFFRDYAQAMYPPKIRDLFANALISMYHAQSLIEKSVGTSQPVFWANPFTTRTLEKIKANMETLRKGRLTAEEAQISIREALKYGGDSIQLEAMLAGIKMLDYLALKYIYAGQIAGYWETMGSNPTQMDYRTYIYRETSAIYHSRASDMMDAVVDIKETFRKAWLNEYTPFRLGIAMGLFDEEFLYWVKFQRRIRGLQYREGESLPDLESLTDGLK